MPFLLPVFRKVLACGRSHPVNQFCTAQDDAAGAQAANMRASGIRAGIRPG